MSDTVLLIISCKKYAHKAAFQRQSWLPSLPPSIHYYHVVGDIEKCSQESKDYIVDDHSRIIYTNTKDDYLSLPHKVITGIQAVHETMTYSYIYKTDDDQIVTDIDFFNKVASQRSSHEYGGHVLYVDGHYSGYHEIHSEIKDPIWLDRAIYCTGRFYFLSKKAIEGLLPKKDWFKT